MVFNVNQLIIIKWLMYWAHRADQWQTEGYGEVFYFEAHACSGPFADCGSAIILAVVVSESINIEWGSFWYGVCE